MMRTLPSEMARSERPGLALLSFAMRAASSFTL
jgi:hypothetical protein